LVDRIQTALGIDVEAAQRFDFVVEQVQPVGQYRTHGKQVDEAAAYAEFAGRGNLGNMRVVGQGQLAPQAFFVEFGALAEGKGISSQKRRRGQPVQGGGYRHRQDIDLALQQRV